MLTEQPKFFEKKRILPLRMILQKSFQTCKRDVMFLLTCKKLQKNCFKFFNKLQKMFHFFLQYVKIVSFFLTRCEN